MENSSQLLTTTTRETQAGVVTRTITFAQDARLIAIVTEKLQRKRSARVTTDLYFLREIPSEIGGRGFEVEKNGDAELRHVLIEAPYDSCTCKWGTFNPNDKPCRHIDIVKAAIEQGLL